MAKMNLYGAKEFEEKLEVCQKRAPARIITYLEKEGKQIRTAYRKKLKQEAKSNPKKITRTDLEWIMVYPHTII